MTRLLITSSNHNLLMSDPRPIRLILLQGDDDKSGVDETKQVADCNNAVLQAPIHCLPSSSLPPPSSEAVLSGEEQGRQEKEPHQKAPPAPAPATR